MPWRARCRETGAAGSASGLEKRTGSNPGTALQADSTNPQRNLDRAPRVTTYATMTGEAQANPLLDHRRGR